MRITCKCGGRRYKSTGPDPELLYYKCNNCNMMFTQKLRGPNGSTGEKRPAIEILSTLADQLRDVADSIDLALEVMREETEFSPRIEVKNESKNVEVKDQDGRTL